MENLEQYKKGFNQGYLLKKYYSQLMDSIYKAISLDTDYFRGLKSGKEQVEKELTQSRLSEIENIKRDSNKDIERDR